MSKQLIVGIADMKLTRQEGTIITYALGSCIGITFYDSMIKMGALVHIMLPEAAGMMDDNVFKYADSGIRETIRKLAIFGGVKSRMVCKIAGGARMFGNASATSFGNIGQRNSDVVKQIIRMEGIRLTGEDVGENYARTMLFDVSNGMVTIRSYGRKELIL